ncbi:MAG: preprotein translocase subunit SecY [Clostridiales bacterium]|nr:preprotein translocase subunit SecY [Clostridiales bacterium]
MLESLRKVWKIDDLRKKLIYTFLMLLLYRLVGVIPAPGVDAAKVMSSAASDLPLLELVNMMTGNAFSQMTIMAMGITPYINASIIMQLLTIAIPALERMSRDEEGGREKIQRISRYVTVALAAIQAIGLVAGLGYIKAGWLNYVLVGVSMAGGTALAMWIGERITDKGIGNGISLLIFAGIISNLFNGIIALFSTAITSGTASAWIAAISIIVVALVMTVVVTFIDLGERRIPLQIAKQVKGRRVYGGQNTHMSLKVVSVGVLPMIFAYSFLAFPGTLIQLIGGTSSNAYIWWMTYMNSGSVWYMIISALLIVAFTFFYSSISFDPKKQAEQLVQQGAVIPGTRGKNIQKYLQNTVNRLNLFAALFLAVLAAVPTLLTSGLNAQVPFAASSILIAVSVALEFIRTIEGEMSIRGIEMDMENGGFM